MATFEADDILSLITSLNTSLGQIRDAIKNADAALSATRTISGTTNQITVTQSTTTTALTLSLPNPLNLPGLVGVNETANTFMGIGVTVNQADKDNEAYAAKSSDVGHPFTAVAEADTYFTIRKETASAGGVLISGFKDSDANANRAILIHGLLGETADTDDDTTSDAVVMVRGTITDGSTGQAAIADAGNLFAIDNNGTVHVLFKGDGTIHASDTTWADALQDHDDAALVEDLELYLTEDKDKNYSDMIATGRYDRLRAVGLIGKATQQAWDTGKIDADGKLVKARPLFNLSRTVQLHQGYARQKHQMIEALWDEMEVGNPGFRGRMNANLNARRLGQLRRP